jgi:hypothetical protein
MHAHEILQLGSTDAGVTAPGDAGTPDPVTGERAAYFQLLKDVASDCGAVEDRIQDRLDEKTRASTRAKNSAAAWTALLGIVGTLTTGVLAIVVKDDSLPAGISGGITGGFGAVGGIITATSAGEDPAIDTLRQRKKDLSDAIRTTTCPATDTQQQIVQCSAALNALRSRCRYVLDQVKSIQ